MTWNSNLNQTLGHLIEWAQRFNHDHAVQGEIINLKNDLDEPLTIMIAGEFKAGKSTFLNALLGSRVLTVDITPTTAILTKLTYGPKKKMVAHYKDSREEVVPISQSEYLTAEREQGKEERDTLEFVEIQLPVEGYYCDGDGNTNVNRNEDQGGGYMRGNPDGIQMNNL